MNKSDMIEAILKLDAEAATEGKTNAELEALLADLTPAKEEPKKFPFEALGAITCKKGILSPGAEVTADMVSGDKNLKALVKRGLVKANK